MARSRKKLPLGVSLTRMKEWTHDENLHGGTSASAVGTSSSTLKQDQISFILPWPPSVNHYWQFTPHGVFVAPQGRRYKTFVAVLARTKNFFPERLEGPLSLEADCYPPDNRKRDIDNVLKALLDSLTHAGAWHDDSQVKALHFRMLGAVRPGRVELRLRPLGA